jgi:hypothetical protein
MIELLHRIAERKRRLPSETVEAVQRLAKAKGLPASDLIEAWVVEKVASLPTGPHVAQ